MYTTCWGRFILTSSGSYLTRPRYPRSFSRSRRIVYKCVSRSRTTNPPLLNLHTAFLLLPSATSSSCYLRFIGHVVLPLPGPLLWCRYSTKLFQLITHADNLTDSDISVKKTLYVIIGNTYSCNFFYCLATQYLIIIAYPIYL